MRLIDADGLLAEIKTLPIMSNWGEAFFPQLVQEQPTIDAVPVVRCQECKFAYRIDSPTEQYDCRKISFFAGWLPPQHFCSYGERREDYEGR